jgi:two-component system KDP operon response regulator KdpE
MGNPDVVLIDPGLSDIGGVDVSCRLCEWFQIPIVIISVRDQKNEKIHALDADADDYLAKTFEICELPAQVQNEEIWLVENLKFSQVCCRSWTGNLQRYC